MAATETGIRQVHLVWQKTGDQKSLPISCRSSNGEKHEALSRVGPTGEPQREGCEMNEQMSFADVCASRHKGNPESVAAHAKIAESKERQRFHVLFEIEKSGERGLTTDELAVKFGSTPNAVSPRCTELLRDGLIKRNGRRPTRSGCTASVLIAV